MIINRLRIVLGIFLMFSLSTLFKVQGQGKAYYEGYTLYNPLGGTTTYLIDMKGDIVHSWTNLSRAGYSPYSVYLRENGNIIRDAASPNRGLNLAAAAGLIQEIDWDGNVVWEFDYKNDEHNTHHDIEPMPNGNVLVIAGEVKSAQEARDAGFNTNREIWPDLILEIQPQGDSATIVWEWHLWDHLVQENDPSKDNYGVVADHPELFSVDLGSSKGMMFGGDWMHMNGISYNPDLDQIAFTSHWFSEIYVIDHSTTTEEATGHTGGKSGKGGDILYRWGNPQNYGASGTQYFDVVHSAFWVPAGYPHEGNLLTFNNGETQRFSEIIEIEPPVDDNGNYSFTPGTAYAPSEPAWVYSESDFYSMHFGHCQRLPNGNTFIVETEDNGKMFEVTESGEKVWEYSPGLQVVKAHRYGADYPGLANLNSSATIPKQVFNEKSLSIYPNPCIRMFSIDGKKLFSGTVNSNNFRWNTKRRSCGVYLLNAKEKNGIYAKCLNFEKIIRIEHSYIHKLFR